MPDRYEREIEDILRRSAGRGLPPRRSTHSNPPRLRLNFSERGLVIAIFAAVFGGGWAYAHGSGTLTTGLISLGGFVCIALVALSPFFIRERYTSSRWR